MCARAGSRARHDWVVMADSNVLMAPGFLAHLLATWSEDTGLVFVGAGRRRAGAACGDYVECAFLNTHHARWLLTGDTIGLGFGLGKTLVMRKSLIEKLGGLDALASNIAEDTAATKLVRAAGLRVRLSSSRSRIRRPANVRRCLGPATAVDPASP